MAGELGSVNYDQWKTASPPEGPEAVEVDPRDVIVTPNDVDAAVSFILAQDTDPGDSENKIKLLADTLKAYMDYAQDREILETLVCFVARKVRQLGPLATGEEVQLLGKLRQRFPFLVASGEVPRE